MKKTIILAVLSLTAQFTMALDQGVVIIPAEQKNSAVIENSSEFNRLKKSYTGYYEAVLVNTVGGGVALGYFLDRNSQVIVDMNVHSGAFLDGLFSSFSGYSDKVHGNSVGAHYKYFNGNSFFVRGGVSFNSLKVERTHHQGAGLFSSPTPGATSNYSGNSVNLVLGIGNDWQFGNFTWGFDWYRVKIPVSTSLKDENYASESDKISLSNHQDSYLKKPIATFSFHVGASF